MTHLIQNGAFFLQGWIGWGQRSCATVMTEREATKMLKRVHAAGCGNAFVVPREAGEKGSAAPAAK